MSASMAEPGTVSTLPLPPPPPPPRVPLDFLDAPSQRLYAAAAIGALQVYKLSNVVQYLAHGASFMNLLKWQCIDWAWIVILPWLRIPWLEVGLWRKLILFSICAFFNVVFFLFLPSSIYHSSPTTTGYTPNVDGHAHLLGMHTVRLSPISTAQLNPAHLSFCLTAPYNEVLIPILMNNSHPTSIRYSVSALGSKSPKFNHTLNAKEIAKLDKQWQEEYGHVLSVTRSGTHDRATIEDADPYDDEYENDDWDIRSALAGGGKGSPKRIQDVFNAQMSTERKRPLAPAHHRFYTQHLDATQSIRHISVSRPGVVRLEAMKASNGDVRVSGGDVVVVSCPTVRFEDVGATGALKKQECAGATKEMKIIAEGVAPLRLKWHKEINGKRDSSSVEGLEGNPDATNLPLSQNVTIPITVSLSTPGRHRYVIDSVEDGVGNSFYPSLASQEGSTIRTVEVIRKSSVAFKHCDSTHSIDLLKGDSVDLMVALQQGADGSTKADIIQSIEVQYVPPPNYPSATPWVRTIKAKKGPMAKEMLIPARHPGTYTILKAQGAECSSDILSPETCKVVQPPEPNAEIKLRPLTDQCSGDVGVRASLVLRGTPPFTVFYTEKRGRNRAIEKRRAVQSARDEIILQPESSGQYTYEFTHISDDKYRSKIPLIGPGRSITQVVHPRASADFVRSQQGMGRQVLSSCSGNEVKVDVDLRGTSPWALEFQVGDALQTVKDIAKSRSSVTFTIPKDIDADGGLFQIDLVSVVDANGCKQTLNVPGISVNVQRVLPTVKFYSSEGSHRTTTLQGETAVLPLRLTGEGPWKVQYRRAGDPASTRTESVNSPNSELRVLEKGTYELAEVHDKRCSGFVVPQEGTWVVDWVPKPTVQFSPSAGFLAKNDSILRPSVCEGIDDFAEVRLTGRAPYQISYSISGRDGHDDALTFNSVQATARLQLRTAKAGHFAYRLASVGDASYLPQHESATAHAVRGQYLEQNILGRPSAYFKSFSRLSYCLEDAFVARSDHGNDGLVILQGQPPFTLGLTVKNFATNEAAKETITVLGHDWKVNLPSYRFRSMGATLVTIDTVTDSSPCSEATIDPAKRSIWVDVAETAAIVPFDRKNDYCVGDPVSFQLEGTPPWTVKYSLNRHTQEVQAKQSKFTRIPDVPGTLKVLSIAHQQNMCKKVVDDIEVTVHAIPTASVSFGKSYEDIIREGEQATITFELSGTPPFTFTYQRTELPTGKKSRHAPKVLETHTVSGISSKTYSIYSAQEGTWTVTFIADKFCRYPPTPPDGTVL
ncbi:hypothetical protein FRB95_007899 [Tulasnella sp. JGI-2019a]|nr:hypothetical protein FRB95_007899 [Tulasnella sp. JGI-2019a]